MKTVQEVELCFLLKKAAREFASIQDLYWSSLFKSGPEMSDFILACVEAIDSGTISLEQKHALWKIFAPTCDFDDAIGAAELGDGIFGLITEIYGERQ